MSRPAGQELRRWFTYMVALLLFVNIAAVAGGVLTYSFVHSVTDKYQPFSAAAAAAEKYTVLAQRDMYEYLSELSESNDSTLKNIDQLFAALDRAAQFAPTAEKASALTEIRTMAGQYRLAVEQLPAALKGSRDWSRVEEIRSSARRIGGSVAASTSTMAAWSQDQIRERNQTLSVLTTGAMVTFFIVLVLSVIVLLALRHWWTRFQDTLLGL